MPALGYAMQKEARKVLYLMLRHFAPDIVLEISPNRRRVEELRVQAWRKVNDQEWVKYKLSMNVSV